MEEKYLKYDICLDDSSEWIFVSQGTNKQHLHVYVQEVGEFITKGKAFTEREGLKSYIITYMIEGFNKVEYRGNQYNLGPGNLFWLNCEDGYRVSSDKTAKSVFVHFYGENISYYYDRFYALNNNSCNIKLNQQNMLDQKIYNLIQLYRNGTTIYADFKAAEIITALMTEILLMVLPKPQSDVYGEYVNSALDIIQNNFTQRITLDYLSDKICVSKFYLSRLFKKNVGMTINEYLTLVRISRAKELLRQTNLPVNEICEQIGMDNQSFFIKTFKRYEKTTPSKYRKEWM